MRWFVTCLWLALLVGVGEAGEPAVTASAQLELDTGQPEVVVRFAIPEKHYIYADQIRIDAASLELTPIDPPTPQQKHDPFSGKEVGVYEQDTVLRYRPSHVPEAGIRLTVGFQACNDSICFRPESETFLVGGRAALSATNMPAVASDGVPEADGLYHLSAFRIAGKEVGYLKVEPFIAFIQGARSGTMQEDSLRRALATRGVWLVVVLILLGGLALNLTPCVLPMIPVNIAIIGAGAQAGSRVRGFGLGLAYGVGIAFVYGVLGVFAILTGTRFGTLNASPWFNLAIAIVFIVLALAMFDLFRFDFSRFQSATGPRSRGSFITALVMGGVAALLAGACVAPVLISVLLLAADLHSRHMEIGLALPFLLGIGMALPWPFAGAGLSFLPKPGKWMERVKIGFGVIILLLALWYGRLGISLLVSRSASARDSVVAAQQEQVKKGWLTSLDSALALARKTGQPVFIDFWASWCKNCLHMEETTFKDPAVIKALDAFVRVKVQAEDLSAPVIREMLDQFGVVGLPTYVVLRPLEKE